MFDLVANDWRTPNERAIGSDQIACSASTQFQQLGSDASVTETVTNNGTGGALANTATVSVTISWSEGQNVKTYTVSTLVAQYGIHIY